MGGWIIKAALNGSALHRPKSEHALVPGSDFQIQLVTPPDRAGLRITDENNCNLCFDYRIKHNERKYLYFLCLITQNISLCSSLAPPAPLFARKEKKKTRACEKLLRLWFIGEWRLENSLGKMHHIWNSTEPHPWAGDPNASTAWEYHNTNILYEIISGLIICRTHQSVPDFCSPNINLMSSALLPCSQTLIYLPITKHIFSKWIQQPWEKLFSKTELFHPFKPTMRASPTTAIKFKPNKTNKNNRLGGQEEITSNSKS